MRSMTNTSNSSPKDYQDIEKLFQTTAESTRKILNCDRVIIYDGSSLPESRVIAESVAAEYPSVLGEFINDPFLADEYLEEYCYGKTLAIDNIYITSQDRLEALEKLEVKSLAISPIVVEGKLVAFLVAHQCVDFQPWNGSAIDFLTEKANIAGIALESIAKAENLENPTQFSTSATVKSDRNSILKAREKLLLKPSTSLYAAKPTSTSPISENFSNMNSQPSDRSNGNFQFTEQKTLLEVDRHKTFLEASNNISLETEPQGIFNTAVKEVRQLLECDRVVIYCLDEDNYGIVVAESVTAKWSKALGKMFDDPCLAVRYMEEYLNGRVRAISDIRDSKVTPCYREQLEELEVKANLVTPIISEGKLFGLLIAHQCSESRIWQESEISWVTEIASQVGLMLQYAELADEKQKEARQLSSEAENNWNKHFTDAIQYIRQSLNRDDILKASVKEVRRILNCDRVVVYSMDRDFRYGTVIAESVAAGCTRALNKEIDDPCFEPTYRDKYLNGRVRAWNNIYESGMTRCYIEQLEELEVKANLVAPIISEGKLFGLLVSHQCNDFRDWQQPEVRWTAQIATQVGFALDNAKLLFDARQLQHQLKNEAQLTKYFTDATRYIRESLQQEDILDVSVEEVRRVLDCDRVVVYSMNRDFRYGTVIAESVAPGWTRALNKKIDDPCFEPTYREKYLNGRVRAWNNIYESGMTKCYIEQLEKLEVKANLVTPIVSEGKLFGLLVAHQCSDFRDWQQPEIRWVAQIATQVGFALDNAELLVHAKQLKQQVDEEQQWTEYFTDATLQIRQSIKMGDILKTSVREVRRVLRCDRVLVYSMNSDDYGEIVAESVAPGWTRSQGKIIKDPCFEAKYFDKYRNGRVRAWNNIYEAGMTKCHIEQLEDLEIKANIVTPIINEGKLFGLLVASQCDNFREWQQTEIRWLTQIATQVAFALDNAKLLEELRSTQTDNQISHQQQEQTETLKHQLVEMLAENGDAYQTLSQEAMRQSETTIDVLHQIQKVADSFSSIASHVRQIQFQEQQNHISVQATQDSLELAVGNVSQIQHVVRGMETSLKNVSNSCQQLVDAVNSIKDISKQIVQQSMNMTRAVSRGEISERQNSLFDLSDNIFALMQQLFEASARVDPLFATIQTEVREKQITIDSEAQKLVAGIAELQAIRQKLERVIVLNSRMHEAIADISQSLENQTQSSVFAKESIQEVAVIAERISEQSIKITQSFNQLVSLVQKL